MESNAFIRSYYVLDYLPRIQSAATNATAQGMEDQVLAVWFNGIQETTPFKVVLLLHNFHKAGLAELS